MTSSRLPHSDEAEFAAARAAAKLNTEADKIIERLGFPPSPEEMGALADAIGELLPELAARAEGCRSFLATHRHAEGTAYAFETLLRHARPALAERAVAWLETTRSAGERVELVAISEASAGRKTVATVVGTLGVAADRQGLVAFVSRHLGYANIYVGVQPRRSTFGGMRRGRDTDISKHTRILLDVDPRHQRDAAGRDVEEPLTEWMSRRAALLTRLQPLAPTALIATGGGVQVVFDVEPTADQAEIRRRLQALKDVEASFESDPVRDLARIGRLPWSINVPTRNKRDRGRRISLAHEISIGTAPRCWVFDDLVASLLGRRPEATPQVPERAGEASTPDVETVRPSGAARHPVPADRRAPTADLADAALRALPNDSTSPDWPYADRATWIRVAHAHRGAGGTLDAFIEWSDRAGGDAGEAERAWVTLNPSQIATGWRHLLEEVARHAPGFIDARRAELGIAAAEAFDDDLDDDASAKVAEAQLAVSVPRRGGEMAAETAVKFLRARGVALWRDPNGAAHATLSVGPSGGVQHVALDDDDGRLAVQAMLAQGGITVVGQKLRDVLELLAAHAATGGVVQEAPIRVAAEVDKIWLDRGASDGIVYEVSASGVRRVAMRDAPHAFIRPAGTRPLPYIPDMLAGSMTPGFISAIGREINLPPIGAMTADDAGVQARAALITCLVGTLYREGTVPHLLVGGPAGSGKTTAVRRLLDLVSPTVAGVLGDVRDAKHLAVLARWSPVLALDNVSGFNREVQDALCRLSSGAAWADRRLYRDGSMVTWTLHRPVVATALGGFGALRGDLADRSLVLQLVAHPGAWSEATAARRWEAARPGVFAAMLCAVALGLANRAAVDAEVDAGGAPAKSPRYRDVAVLAEAVARAEGWPAWLLWAALAAIRRAGQDATAGADPFVGRLVAVLKAKGGSWRGTAAEWCSEITAPGLLPSWGPRGGPNSGQSWSQRLQALETTLRELGWSIDRDIPIGRGASKRRGIAITAPAEALAEVPDLPQI